MSDLESTQIIQPGSRVEYNYLFAGPENEMLSIRNFLEERKESGDEIEMLDDDSSSLSKAVDRSENFFLLGGLIAVLLSACTISIASQRFTRRHISYVAILKTLGMRTLHIRALYFLIFFYTIILTLIFGPFFVYFFIYNILEYHLKRNTNISDKFKIFLKIIFFVIKKNASNAPWFFSMR